MPEQQINETLNAALNFRWYIPITLQIKDICTRPHLPQFTYFYSKYFWLRQTSIHNDTGLLQRLAADDPKAYTDIYEAYFPLLLQSATRFLKIKPAAEDVCNEVFLTLWQNRKQLPEIQSLQAYLLTSVRNRSINALKSIARSHAMAEEVKNTFPPHTIDAEAQLLNKEYVDFIKRGIQELPNRAKEVFTLCREEGCSYEEASARLGISRDAVKWHMVVSMKKLKTWAEKDLGISFSLLLTLLTNSL
jgi:RNA polymerase sigma-70 factor (family 1)